MAFGRSASGPGGLSINTNSANSLFGSSTGTGTTPAAGGMFGSTQAKPAGGLFGATTSGPQTGGLFGSTTATQPQSGGLFGSTTASTQAGGLFGSTAATTQPQSGGLFGSARPAQSGGLFGSTAASTQPQTGGLFGSSQPAQSGGLFGNANINTSQPAQTGGLFGSSQPQQTGGLFGSSTTTSQPQQTGGLFPGLAGQSNQPTGGGGLFGSSNTTQPAQGGLFSNMNQNQNKPNPFGNSTQPSGQLNQNTGQGLFGSTLGGGLSLGQSTNQQQQQTVPGVRIDPANIRGTTRFNDLHDELQKEIQKFDDIIQAQIQLKTQCDAIMTAHDSQLAQVPNDVEFCRRKLIGVENAADSDVQAISLAQRLIKTDAENAKLSFKAIDNLKLPPQYHNNNMWTKPTTGSSQTQADGDAEAQDIVSFFSSTADEIASTLSSYQKHMIEIEQHLRNVEASSVSQQSEILARKNGVGIGQDDPMEQLTGALMEFESSLLGVAGRVGGAREGLQSLQLGRFTGTPKEPRTGYRNGVY
ncbi:hypothetical protein BDZ45DRAFT_694024 [Acephala macrosclerotiorum]|nr:hypothetical protein BDZ45DRAFT_694024 [Acephala macrosclerotiorum]